MAKEPDAMTEEVGEEGYGHRYFLPSNAKVIKPSERAEQQAFEGREVLAQHLYLAVDLASLMASMKVFIPFFLSLTKLEIQKGSVSPLLAPSLPRRYPSCYNLASALFAVRIPYLPGGISLSLSSYYSPPKRDNRWFRRYSS